MPTTITGTDGVSQVQAGAVESGDLPAEAYQKNNILGTVSESGGVPTGAIIERGSNSNGEYVKFADGTMIASIRTPSITNDGTLKTTDVIRSWPVSFLSKPIGVATQSVGHGDLDAGAAAMTLSASGGLSSTTYRVGFRNNLSSTYSLSADIIGIGRWY